MRTASFLAIACCTSLCLRGQIVEVGQHPTTLHQISSLGSGVRLISHFLMTESAGTRTIYDHDLSVFRTLNYPAPPTGMTWGNMRYITEALFDTDPSTIEFVMVASPTDGPGDFATFIYREDGTELFAANPGSLVDGLGSFNGIYTVEDQSYMVIYTDMVLGPPTRIFTLPGTLPCMDCHGSPTDGMATGEGPVLDPASGMSLQPNPTNNELRVGFGNAAVDGVHIYDAAGHLVLEQRTVAGDAVTLTVSALGLGAYTVAAVRDGKRVAVLPLVIQR